MSWAVWVNNQALVAGGNVAMGRMTASVYDWLFYQNSGSPFAWNAYVVNASGTSVHVTASSNPSVGKWYRLLATYDGAALKFYLNGASQGTIAQTGNVRATSGALVNFGRYQPGATFWNGWLDSAMIWNRALSAQEAGSDYMLGQLGYPGILNRWTIQDVMAQQTAAAANGLLMRRRRALVS